MTSRATYVRLALGLAIVVLGLHLHFDDVMHQVLMDDEEHALRVAMTKGPFEILCFHGPAEHSTLLTLYAKFLMSTIGLTEFRFRIPVLICDVALLLAPLLFVRRLGWTVVLIAMALIATSPVVVQYSIIARPYTPAALCVLLAVYFWDRWVDSRSVRTLAGFVLMAAGSIILHLYCLFPMLALMGLTFLRVLRNGLPQREFWKAGLAISAVVLLVMGPGLPLLYKERIRLVGEGQPSLRSFTASYMILLGKVQWLRWLFPAILVAGAWHIRESAPRLGLAIVAQLAVLLLMLFATHPLGTIAVWARYYFVVWPLALILAAVGIEWIALALYWSFRRAWRRETGQSRLIPSLLALTAGLGLAVAVERLSPMILFRLKPTSFRSSKIMVHPNMRWRDPPNSVVFRTVRESRDEFPTVMFYPTIPTMELKPLLAQGLFGMYVISASPRTPLERSRGIYRTLEIPIRNRNALRECGAKYLIVVREQSSETLRQILENRYGPVVCSDRERDLYDLSRDWP